MEGSYEFEFNQHLTWLRQDKTELNPTLDVKQVQQVKPDTAEVWLEDEKNEPKILSKKEIKKNMRKVARHLPKCPEMRKLHIETMNDVHDVLSDLEQFKKKLQSQ